MENLEIKQSLFATIEPQAQAGAAAGDQHVLACRSRTLPPRYPIPGRLVGLHFFNPVAQMPLVEVVRGAQSREDEVKRGAAFVAAIDKFPLIDEERAGLSRQPRADALHVRRHAAAGAG